MKNFPSSSVVCTPDFTTLVVGEGGLGLRILDTKRAQAPAGGGVGSGGGAAAAGGRRVEVSPSRLGQAGGGGGGGGGVEGGSTSRPVSGAAAGGSFRVPGRASVVAQATAGDQEAVLSAAALRAGSGASSPAAARSMLLAK